MPLGVATINKYINIFFKKKKKKRFFLWRTSLQTFPRVVRVLSGEVGSIRALAGE